MGYELPQLPVHRFLDIVGNGTGSIQATGDYSTPTLFMCIPTPDERLAITRLIVLVNDSVMTDASKYGALSTLANGIKIEIAQMDDIGVGPSIANDAVLLDLTSLSPVKSLAGWKGHCFDGETTPPSPGDEFFAVRWSFFKAGYDHLLLNGRQGQYFRAHLRDDLTGLNEHTFKLDGHHLDKNQW